MKRFSQAIRGWPPLAVLPVATSVLWPTSWPRWLLMWSLAGAIYAGCKWLTWRRTPATGASAGRHVAYLLLWPGMDGAAFLDVNRSAAIAKPKISEWLGALLKFALGIAFIRDDLSLTKNLSPLLVGWIGMVGVVLTLHFGLFHLLSCLWRTNGIDGKPLMNAPVRSTSLADLWGKRWNVAFRDLMHRFLFKPFVPRFGSAGATWLGFAVSGVIHDVVMSLPPRSGYGLPTLFFLIQAAGLMVERSSLGRRLGLGHGWRGWLFAMLVLIGPSPLLLHRPFVEEIVVPFVLAVRSL